LIWIAVQYRLDSIGVLIDNNNIISTLFFIFFRLFILFYHHYWILESYLFLWFKATSWSI